jgi:D-arabinose 1-dehydrogenase-like Zn-dependent alcohol dehydrogenase
MVESIIGELINGKIELNHYELEAGKGQAIVKIDYMSPCDLDMILYKQSLSNNNQPIRIGYEGAGRVVVTNDCKNVKPEDPVIIHPWGNNGIECPGTLATHIVVNEEQLVKIEYNITGIEASLIGCSSAIAVSAIDKLIDMRPGMFTMVVGGNYVGLNLITMINLYNSTEVTVADRSWDKLYKMEECGGGIRLIDNSGIRVSSKAKALQEEKLCGYYDLICITDTTMMTIEEALTCLTSTGKVIVIDPLTPTGKCNDDRVIYAPYGNASRETVSYLNKIVCHMVYNIEYANKAFSAIANGDHNGRVVIRCSI